MTKLNTEDVIPVLEKMLKFQGFLLTLLSNQQKPICMDTVNLGEDYLAEMKVDIEILKSNLAIEGRLFFDHEERP